MKNLVEIVKKAYSQKKRLVVPLLGFPGVKMVGTSIKLAQQNYMEHFKVIRKLVDTFSPDLVFPLMDLSVEANALGRFTLFPRDDSATVPKDSFIMEEIDELKKINIEFDSRVIGYVETIRLLSKEIPEKIIKGSYVTGPYTLAALIIGADEAAMDTVLRKDKLHSLMQFTTEQIRIYSDLLISAGAEVICILEPTAVMLGPEQFREFSSFYTKKIVDVCREKGVNTIYHTCGNTMHLIEKMVESGVSCISLDSKEVGVELEKVAERVPEHIIVIGNISPVATMLNGKPEQVKREVYELMTAMDGYPNFVLSTGCDLPQETPIENIHAFMKAGREYIIS